MCAASFSQSWRKEAHSILLSHCFHPSRLLGKNTEPEILKSRCQAVACVVNLDLALYIMCLLLLHLHKEKGANFSRPLSSLAMESEYPGHVFHAQKSAILQAAARFQLSLHAVSWPNGLLAIFQRLCKMTDDFCWCSITLGISQLVLIISEDVYLSLLAAQPSSHWTSVSLVFNSAILFLLHLIWFLFRTVFGIFF